MGARVIVITSGKGGVGKTTTTANIGAGLADKGHKVLLIDTDIGLRNLDVVMGLENRIVYDLIDVIEGRCRISQALIKDKRCPNLVLLPAAQIRDKNDVNTDQMKELIFSLKENFDYILIDCPAGIEQGFKNAIVAADEAIVVTTPEVSATRDADRIIGLLEAAGIKEPRLVVNRLRIDMVKDKNMLSVEDILDILAVKLLGVVPDDENVVISTNKGEELQEIYKIASGGELSRIMLGFKKVLSDRDKIATLVFDEIDTGISGITAQIVGEKLAEISKNHQLLVISHLPQISVLSDTHFIISKETVGDITLSKVLCANYDEKVMEISRLIGGANINETTIRQSKEMIEIANQKKERLRCIEK